MITPIHSISTYAIYHNIYRYTNMYIISYIIYIYILTYISYNIYIYMYQYHAIWLYMFCILTIDVECFWHVSSHPQLEMEKLHRWDAITKSIPNSTSITMTYHDSILIWLVVVVVYLPLWKIWTSVGMMIFPNILGNIKNVPNHQPVIMLWMVAKSCTSCRWFISLAHDSQ